MLKISESYHIPFAKINRPNLSTTENRDSFSFIQTQKLLM